MYGKVEKVFMWHISSFRTSSDQAHVYVDATPYVHEQEWKYAGGPDLIDNLSYINLFNIELEVLSLSLKFPTRICKGDLVDTK